MNAAGAVLRSGWRGEFQKDADGADIAEPELPLPLLERVNYIEQGILLCRPGKQHKLDFALTYLDLIPYILLSLSGVGTPSVG